eukprot:SAG11_NODE_3335_length_2519_cov_1.665289_4_plen_86_part_00
MQTVALYVLCLLNALTAAAAAAATANLAAAPARDWQARPRGVRRADLRQPAVAQAVHPCIQLRSETVLFQRALICLLNDAKIVKT